MTTEQQLQDLANRGGVGFYSRPQFIFPTMRKQKTRFAAPSPLRETGTTSHVLHPIGFKLDFEGVVLVEETG